MDERLHGRWYDDACGAALALEIIGERWSILIVRELLLGPRRFSDLRAQLPGLSAKVLTERLIRLEKTGVLSRRKLRVPVPVQLYELTEWGYMAERAILELGRWAVRSPLHDPTLPLTPTAFMLSLRTMLRPADTGTLVAGFAFNDDLMLARFAEGSLYVARVETLDEADVIFRARTPSALLPFFYGKHPLGEVERQTGLVVERERALAERFADLFALPPKCT